MARFWYLIAVALVATGCIYIESPPEGTFTTASTVTVSGTVDNPGADSKVRVNGVVASIAGDGSWTATIPTTAGSLTTEVVAEYLYNGTDVFRVDKSLVVNGAEEADGSYSPEGVGLVFTNSGLGFVSEIVGDLAGDAFDIGALLTSGGDLIPTQSVFTFTITGDAYEAGIGGYGIDLESTSGGVDADITVTGLYIGVDINITDNAAINWDCKLEIDIPIVDIAATYDLEPDAANPTSVDVNQIGAANVDIPTIDWEFITGPCDQDTLLIGNIIDSLAGSQIEPAIIQGFSDNLDDPDGAGPADSPIADGIETALAGIDIQGQVGSAVGVELDAPIQTIDEQSFGLTLSADSSFTANPGGGAAQCPNVPGAPDLTGSLSVPSSFPALTGTTPGGQPYDLGLVISQSAFNQLFRALAECGLLNTQITEFDFGGIPVPLTAQVLSNFVPELLNAPLTPETPMAIRTRPTFAPMTTNNPAPPGSLAELLIPNYVVEFVSNPNTYFQKVQVAVGLDLSIGLDLQFDPATSSLAPVLAQPTPADITARVTSNLVDTDPAAIEAVMPTLVPGFFDSLAGGFTSFPVPSLLGLELEVVDTARVGNNFALFADFSFGGGPRITWLSSTTSGSTGEYAEDPTTGNSREYRISRRAAFDRDSVNLVYRSVTSADACCASGSDATTVGNAVHKGTFTIAAEPGEAWQLDLNHSIRGVHTIKDEKNAYENGGARSSISNVLGLVRVNGGPWMGFHIAPSDMEEEHTLGCLWVCGTEGYDGPGGLTNKEFTGYNARTVTGSGPASVDVRFEWTTTAFSNTNSTFPAPANGGDEVSVRLGQHGTTSNGTNANTDDYPGYGNRNRLDDGHFVEITLS